MRILVLILTLLFHYTAKAESGPSTGFGRVQLSDVDIQGEANSDGMRFSQRRAHDISDRLKLRTDFMDRVEEFAPRTWSKSDSAKSLTAH
jgi:hypothetical protein